MTALRQRLPRAIAPSRRTALGALGAVGGLVVLGALAGLPAARDADLPTLPAVLAAVARLSVDPSFLVHVGATLGAAGLGLLLAAVVAVPAGVAIAGSPLVYRLVSPVVELLRPIPAVIMLPLAILMFGLGLQMKLVLVCYACLWPILFNTVYGVRGADPLAGETARSLGFSRPAVLVRVALPACLPFVLTGIRVAAGAALVVTISTELFAGGALGVGSWLIRATSGTDSEVDVFAACFLLGVVGLAVNHALEGVERAACGWHHGMTKVLR